MNETSLGLETVFIRRILFLDLNLRFETNMPFSRLRPRLWKAWGCLNQNFSDELIKPLHRGDSSLLTHWLHFEKKFQPASGKFMPKIFSWPTTEFTPSRLNGGRLCCWRAPGIFTNANWPSKQQVAFVLNLSQRSPLCWSSRWRRRARRMKAIQSISSTFILPNPKTKDLLAKMKCFGLPDAVV